MPHKEEEGLGNSRAGGPGIAVEPIHQPTGMENHHNASNNLNLLDGDNYSWLDMDEKTLQCLVGGLPLPDVGHLYSDDVAGPSNPTKRLCMCGSPSGEQSNPESWMPVHLGNKEHTANLVQGAGKELPVDKDAGGPSGEQQVVAIDDGNSAIKVEAKMDTCNKQKQGGTKRADAAAAKADRERKRRERLNQCFEDLANACGQDGGSTFRSDRLTIIVDAIRVVRALRVEVNQLRQLNKFLEERVGTLERERAQAMYQHLGQCTAPHGGHTNHSCIGIPSSQNAYNHQPHLLGSHGPAKNHPTDGRYNFLPAANLSEDEKLRPPAA